jgi:hypothetical protein
MDSDWKLHPVHLTFRQALNWTEGKIQRHLICRRKDDITDLGLALALLSFRLPFYAKSTASLEEPTAIADLVLELCKGGNDVDKAVAIEILAVIAAEYLDDHGLYESDARIQLLLATISRICQTFQHKDLRLVHAVKSLGTALGRCVTLDEVLQFR